MSHQAKKIYFLAFYRTSSLFQLDLCSPAVMSGPSACIPMKLAPVLFSAVISNNNMGLD